MYSICFHTVPPTARRLLVDAVSVSRQREAEVLATGSEQDLSAVERTVANSLSLPAQKPGSHFSTLSSAPGRAAGNLEGNGNRPGETVSLLQQQQAVRGVAAPSNPAAGQTVADSRPASSAGQPVGHQTVQGARSSRNAGTCQCFVTHTEEVGILFYGSLLNALMTSSASQR